MSRKFKLWRYITIIWSCLCFVHAGPVERSVRIIREVYPEIEPEKVEGSQAQVCIVGDVVYGAGETVPADQSCLKCKCQPPGVHCETTRCEKKPGCKAIHKPNNCCPMYQCECEYEGKMYGNGERLDTTSGGECRVCYCRGGEVKCAEVSCYIRTDCEGRTVPGQCCPKYEHCPPIEHTLDKLAIKPDSTSEYKPTTEATTRSIIYNTANATSIENEVIETTPSYYNRNFTVEVKNNDEGGIITTAQIPLEINTRHEEHEAQTSEEIRKKEPERTNEPPKITIHEIIPEVKEFTISETQKENVHKTIQGQLLVEEAIQSFDNVPQKPIIETANDLGISDSDLESSEVSEVFQHPPPILRVGDQLLFLKRGEFVSDIGASTPSPVFTIIGAEGLQRGDIDSSEHHETQKEEDEDTNFENVHNESVSALNDYSLVVSLETKENAHLTGSDQINNEEKVNFTEESKTDPVIETIDKIKNNFENSKREITVGQILVEEVTDKSKLRNDTEIENYPTEINNNVENSTIDVAVQLAIIESDGASITEEPEVPETKITSLLIPKKSEKHSVTTKIYEDFAAEEENIKLRSDEVIPLENPAYPPIPEIMSQQDTDEILENTDVPELELSQLKNISDDDRTQIILEAVHDTNLKILPEILTMRNNHSIPENVSHSEWLKSDETEAETLVNEDAILPDSIIKQVVASDEVTTEEVLTRMVNESNEVVENKNIPTTNLPTEGLKSEESMIFSTIIDRDSPQYSKSLTEDDDAVDLLSDSGYNEKNPDEKLRSTETLEDARSEESGENTTPRNSQQILSDSNENVSIDAYQKDSVENEKMASDVEVIDLHHLQANTTNHVIKRNVTHEEDSKTNGAVEQRSSYDRDSDKIFQQLDDEIQLLSKREGNSTMGEEEKKEAQIIFKELFDKVNSSSTEVPRQGQGAEAKARESAILQRVSDAIAKFQLKDTKQSLDTSILGILRDFFSSQYKSYKDN